MCVIIAIANQKGGVGKTDLAVNLSTSLASLGKRVMLIDLDPQSSATDYLSEDRPKLSTADLILTSSVSIQDIVVGTGIDKLDLAPASIGLSAAQIHLANDVNMQFKLRRKLKTIAENYDYIFIDTPPSLGLLTVNALTAANKVLVPVQTHYSSLRGLVDLMETIEKIREEINPGLELAGLVLTMYDKRTRITKEIEENVKNSFKSKVFKTVIPVCVKLAESPSHHKPINYFSPLSKVVEAYTNLAGEFLNCVNT